MLISASKITEWAASNRREAQDTLPELVRRLILESDPQVRKADIPSGDSVALPGLDGVVISEQGFFPEQFLPAGESVWEIGCDKDNPTRKAESDYKTRTGDSEIKEKKSKTYIAVSPYAWTTKNTWASKKPDWKDVRALNANDLAQWLDRCAKTRDWFAATVLGYPITDLATDVLPVLLLTGGWNTQYEADRKVIEAITGRSHDEVEQKLQRFSRQAQDIGSAFFTKENSRWKLLAPDMAWEIAEPLITEAKFNRFFEQAKAIFSEIPQDYIAPEDRDLLDMHYVGQGYSTILKMGITEGLARIATTKNTTAPGYNGYKPQGRVDVCLREVFSKTNRFNPAFWVSISPYLSILAEAWDGEFLDCLDDVICKQPEALSHLFQKAKYSPSHRAVSDLLFALQKLAWHPPHLSRVADVLRFLTRFEDPKSNDWGPIRAFQELFVGWFANTAATLEEQRKILARLLADDTQASWPLLIATIPDRHPWIPSRSEPKFRKAVRKDPTGPEYQEHLEALWKLAMLHVGTVSKHWLDLFENFNLIKGTPYFEALIKKLEENADTLDADQQALWERGLWILNHHKQYPHKDWALSTAERALLEAALKKIEPEDPRDRFQPIFCCYAMDLCDEPYGDDYRKAEEGVQARRTEAIKILLKDLDNDSLAAYAKVLIARGEAAAHALASALAVELPMGDKRSDELLLFLLEHPDQKISLFGSLFLAYVIGKQDLNDSLKWADTFVTKLSSDAVSTLWSKFPPSEVIWERLDNPDIQKKYWKKITPAPQQYADGGELLVSKLLEHRQPIKALDSLHWQIYHQQKPLPRLVLDALTLFANAPYNEAESAMAELRPYIVQKLIEYLELSELSELERSELAQLEWVLFPFLDDRSHDVPLSLFKEMAREPGLYVEMLSLMYHPASGERVEPTEAYKRRAKRAWIVIRAWDTLPGENENDGTLDTALLLDWYEKYLVRGVAKGIV